MLIIQSLIKFIDKQLYVGRSEIFMRVFDQGLSVSNYKFIEIQ